MLQWARKMASSSTWCTHREISNNLRQMPIPPSKLRVPSNNSKIWMKIESKHLETKSNRDRSRPSSLPKERRANKRSQWDLQMSNCLILITRQIFRVQATRRGWYRRIYLLPISYKRGQLLLSMGSPPTWRIQRTLQTCLSNLNQQDTVSTNTATNRLCYLQSFAMAQSFLRNRIQLKQ